MHRTNEPIPCGLHRIRTEGHLLLVQFVGVLSMAEFRQISNEADKLIAEYGGLYMLADVEQATTIPAEVRRAVVGWMKTGQIRGIANIKANMTTRGLSLLLINAIRLLTGLSSEVTFVASEAEGRAWVAELERKRLKRAGP